MTIAPTHFGWQVTEHPPEEVIALLRYLLPNVLGAMLLRSGVTSALTTSAAAGNRQIERPES
jgi:hypothetical protein